MFHMERRSRNTLINNIVIIIIIKDLNWIQAILNKSLYYLLKIALAEFRSCKGK